MDETKPATIAFYFEKVPNYATHHADGVLGGITPTGDIFFSFYVERPPIPKYVEQELLPNGALGEIVKFESREGIYREIQTGVIMSKAAANVLLDRLTELLTDDPAPEPELHQP